MQFDNLAAIVDQVESAFAWIPSCAFPTRRSFALARTVAEPTHTPATAS